MAVFVIDRRKKPLSPCSERRARILLNRGRARVVRLRPFVIRLVDVRAEDVVVKPVTVRIDPGSKTSGMAVTRSVAARGAADDAATSTQDAQQDVEVLSLIELEHRGRLISKRLEGRAGHRRFRRARLRYRPARFNNRTRPKGWLAPSLQHRVDTIVSQVRRLQKWLPVAAVVQEAVRFDMQLMQHPNIRGVAYQQGTLFGYEVREYLLEKWQRKCAYCDKAQVPLQIEHITPRSRGGSDRISNLALACAPCNIRKGAQPVAQFLKDKPVRLRRIEAQAKAPLRDAAAVNTTRHALTRALVKTGLQVSTSTGGRTKYNRSRFGVPKTHALDAACCGEMASITGWRRPTLLLKACGRGSYCRARLDKYGFVRGTLMRMKYAFGFATGDLVRADVPKGKKQGTYIGRVAIRETGSFNIKTPCQLVEGISYKHCRILQRGDGYATAFAPTIQSPSLNHSTNAASRRGPYLPALKGQVSRAI